MRPKRKQVQTASPTGPLLPPELNPGLASAVLAIVDTQLATGKPVETRQTLDRLVERGYSPEGARHLIAHIVVREVFEVMAQGKVYDMARFVAALGRLPALPDASG